MLERIHQWWEAHFRIPGVPWWAELIIMFVVMFAFSLGMTAVALLYIPVDYFAGSHAPKPGEYRHPAVRWAFRIARNLVGWFLVVLGILLSLPGVPGQGALTILLGVMLAEFPGKRRLELWLMRKPKVQRAVNALRARFGKPPLEVFVENGARGQ